MGIQAGELGLESKRSTTRTSSQSLGSDKGKVSSAPTLAQLSHPLRTHSPVCKAPAPGQIANSPQMHLLGCSQQLQGLGRQVSLPPVKTEAGKGGSSAWLLSGRIGT